MKYCILLSFLLAIIVCKAQNINPLKIGDHVPIIPLDSIYNFNSTSSSLHHFEGKLVVLDFWGIGCGSCIASFPKLELLQKEFGDKIQIILVTNASKSAIDAYFKRMKIKMPNIMMVVSDKILAKYFPYIFVPHSVWINPEGKVVNITNGYNNTSEHLNDILNGKPVNLILKRDVRHKDFQYYSLDSFLFKLEGKQYVYNSSLLKFNNGLPEVRAGVQLDTSKTEITKWYTNTSVLNLYTVAFQMGLPLNSKDYIFNNRIILDSLTYSFLIKPSDPNLFDAWKGKHWYSYFQRVSVTDKDAYQYMQEDLNRYFKKIYGIRAKLVERNVECIILVDKHDVNSKPDYQNTNKEVITWSGEMFLNLMSINYGVVASKTPFLNESRLKKRDSISMIRNINILDEKPLKDKLYKQGFDLIKEKRKIKYLVID
ncbi:TlpA disulfide reductase family protein [Chitinophaga sp. MM2321]|uniref:TlpA family protein disulfide reductase n=1 Tax=Chitinophaga sp. MM2321 TaxID=3137178 RepID=UPI0032D58672